MQAIIVQVVSPLASQVQVLQSSFQLSPTRCPLAQLPSPARPSRSCDGTFAGMPSRVLLKSAEPGEFAEAASLGLCVLEASSVVASSAVVAFVSEPAPGLCVLAARAGST